ncbi:MAG: pyruvate carboxylase, partial [Verrucomicrobia bacterium]|nr:pyruvate carboxylase [Cytophagales bacterium]
IRLLFVQEADDQAMRKVSFELNGQTRIVEVADKSVKILRPQNRKVSADHEIGSPLQGKLSNILVKAGDVVKENTPLFVIEAMKMETVVAAPEAGTIQKIVLEKGSIVAQDDVVLEF